MQLETVAEQVGDLPYMRLEQARKIQKIISRHKCRNILELGFFHGVSTMYLAAILDGLDTGGRVTTVDFEWARGQEPNILQLGEQLGLSHLIEPHFEKAGYIWRLKAFIEEGRRFDFCYLDGGHMWDDTALAFFLVDKLLHDGGLILFDDINWTAAKNRLYKERSQEEREEKAVERVWSLLVCDHPHYKPLWRKGNWALARKKRKLPLLPVYY